MILGGTPKQGASLKGLLNTYVSLLWNPQERGANVSFADQTSVSPCVSKGTKFFLNRDINLYEIIGSSTIICLQ